MSNHDLNGNESKHHIVPQAEEYYYNMDHKKRGIAHIYSHEFFDKKTLPRRRGTKEDYTKLRLVLETLGFQVTVFKNLKLSALIKSVYKLSKLDHTEYDCALVCVMSHGGLGTLYASDFEYKPDLLWRGFTEESCPSLAGKPKLFFIQACQGEDVDEGMFMSTTETDGIQESIYKFVHEPDFLISFSSPPGFFSWRNPLSGSCFISALTQELHQGKASRHLLHIMALVAQRMAYDFSSHVPKDPKQDNMKQIPYTMSTLTHLLSFAKK